MSKKPTQLKVLSGTVQPCRLPKNPVNFPKTTEVPEPVVWLPNAHAVNEWNRLAPVMHSVGLLTEASLSMFGVYCSLHGKIVQLLAAGECPTGHLLAQLTTLAKEFGITPAASEKIKNPKEKPKENKFANNGVASKTAQR